MKIAYVSGQTKLGLLVWVQLELNSAFNNSTAHQNASKDVKNDSEIIILSRLPVGCVSISDTLGKSSLRARYVEYNIGLQYFVFRNQNK